MTRLNSRVHRSGICVALGIAGLAATALGTGSGTQPSTRAVRDQLDDEQFQRELIGDGTPSDASAAAKVRMLMGESAKRLSAGDPGEATQYVQEQIVREIDRLIEESASRPAPAPRSGKAGRESKQQQVPGNAVPACKPGDSRSNVPGGNPGGSDHVKSADDLRSAAETWGKISPKLRGPVVEGRSERVMRKYKSLIDDYYRAVAVKAAE